MAYLLNIRAGAGSCSDADTAGSMAQTLLAKYGFNGNGSYNAAMTAADRSLANSLANTLDRYNNNTLCS